MPDRYSSQEERSRKATALRLLSEVYGRSYSEVAIEFDVKALDDIPAEKIEAVAIEIRKTQRFMPAICEIREACETFEEARRLGEPELKSRRVELTEEELALVNEKEKWGDLGCNTREEYEACLAELGITEEENEEAAV